MQRIRSFTCVDWSGFRDALVQQVNALLRGSDSVLILDESAIARKGTASAGVARQRSGRQGKLDNRHVEGALCRQGQASLFDTRSNLPRAWIEDPKRWVMAAVPEAERCYLSIKPAGLESRAVAWPTAGSPSMAATARSRSFCVGSQTGANVS